MSESSDIARLLRSGWRWIALGVALGLLGGGAAGFLMPARYTANSYLVVVAVGSTGTTADAANFGKVFARVAVDPVVLSRSPHVAEIGLTPDNANKSARVLASPDAPVLQVVGTGSTAFRAAEVANVVAQAITLYATDRSTDTGFLIRQFVTAEPPTKRSSPRPTLDLALGLVVGLGLGILAALSRRPKSAAASTGEG